MNEKKAEIRIQFRDAPGAMFAEDTPSPSPSASTEPSASLARDELVIRVQPNEAIYLKLNTKKPGEMGFTIEETELDLTYGERYKGVKLPDAYERLILDVFTGSKINFVRSDELEEAWRIVDPILNEIQQKHFPLVHYKFGSFGVNQAFAVAARHGYIYRGTYVWKDEQGNTNEDEQHKPSSTPRPPSASTSTSAKK